jgi:hypothetical protein
LRCHFSSIFFSYSNSPSLLLISTLASSWDRLIFLSFIEGFINLSMVLSSHASSILSIPIGPDLNMLFFKLVIYPSFKLGCRVCNNFFWYFKVSLFANNGLNLSIGCPPVATHALVTCYWLDIGTISSKMLFPNQDIFITSLFPCP